jgi:Helix-turn-helix domain
VAGFLFEWRTALMHAPELIASDRHVAHVVGFHMDEHGRDAWPSLATIAAETDLVRNTVASSLQWLRASGWLVAERVSRRQALHYSAAIPSEPRTRADRTAFMRARRERLGAKRVVANDVPTEQSQTATPLGSDETTASSRKPQLRVVANGDIEWSQTATHELSLTSPTDLTQAVSEAKRSTQGESWIWTDDEGYAVADYAILGGSAYPYWYEGRGRDRDFRPAFTPTSSSFAAVLAEDEAAA